ncbi:MAG: C-terminal binding protein [Acidaminococcus sp.]|uniref:C-terminal binding protein n=1 Tax=Acidaminococcus sp. TaxID=1872103 RepID=UPI002A75F9EF|nr:C-terminal binding protein [Acidaminococcus sp.]MDY2739258.1 C-terminal binding protein [Acidaminococcus sp.]
MVVWIIDEEWTAYDVEISLLTKAFPGVTFRRSSYDFWHDLEKFGSTVDGLIAQVNVPLGDEVFIKMPRLKAISLYGTGCEAVDLEAAQKRGIAVRNVAGYSSEDIAEYVIMGILFLVRRMPLLLKRGESSPWGVRAIPVLPHRLSGLTLAIVGYGQIGRKTALKAKAMGMTVLAYNRSDKSLQMEEDGVIPVTWEEAFSKGDIVSLHLAASRDTAHIVDTHALSLMKKGTYLINTGRGSLLDEKALAEAVRKGTIAGALLDVVEKEPFTDESPLYGMPQIIVTPHISYATEESFAKLKQEAAENLVALMKGDRRNSLTS